MKKPFSILNYQSGIKAMIDFKQQTEAEMKEAAEKWRFILDEIMAALPPRDYEQDYIMSRCVDYIREQMKPYFTYAWDKKFYLERIGNEIYFTEFSGVSGKSTGICHLDN